MSEEELSELRRKMDERLQDALQRMEQVERRQERIESKLDEVIDIFTALKGGLRILYWIGVIAKWLTGVGAAVLLFLYVWKGGSR